MRPLGWIHKRRPQKHPRQPFKFSSLAAVSLAAPQTVRRFWPRNRFLLGRQRSCLRKWGGGGAIVQGRGKALLRLRIRSSVEVSEGVLVKGDARSGERFLPLKSHPSRRRFRRAGNLRSRGHMSRKLPLPLPGTVRALASFSAPPDPWIAAAAAPPHPTFPSHLVLAALLSDAVKIFLHQQRTKCPFLDMLTDQNYSHNLHGRTSQERKHVKVGTILRPVTSVSSPSRGVDARTTV